MHNKSIIFCAMLAAMFMTACNSPEDVVEINGRAPLDEEKYGVVNWWDGLDTKTDLSIFGTPSNASSAVLLTFGANPAGISSIEFTESGLYVIKSEGGISAGSYTASGSDYKLGSLGTVKVTINGAKATVSGKVGDKQVEIEANATKPAYKDDLEKAICRSWKMYKCWYYMKPQNTQVWSDEWSYCDFHAFAEDYYYHMGFTNLMYDETRKNYPENLNGTRVEAIALTGTGHFIVVFDKETPWYGTWKWKDRSTGEISYEFTSGNGGNVYIPKTSNKAFVTPHDEYFLMGFYNAFSTDEFYAYDKMTNYYNYLVLKMVKK